VGLLLNDSQAYCLGIYRNFKPNTNGKLEALSLNKNKEVENLLGAYFSDFLAVATILIIFKVKSNDDKKITKYFQAIYKAMANEFLDINETCNSFGLSILSVAKSVNKYVLPYLKNGQDPKARYSFEKKIPAHYLKLRADYMSAFSDKAYKTTVSDFFAQVGLKI
jgi:hypothetical protein